MAEEGWQKGKDKVFNRTERSIISTSGSFFRNARKSRGIKERRADREQVSSRAASRSLRLVSRARGSFRRINIVAIAAIDRFRIRPPREMRPDAAIALRDLPDSSDPAAPS
jgi:hypothetical protein